MANYIDADKLKAEIERLKTVQLKRIQEGDLVDAEPYDKFEAYNELLDFLSTLESEKPMDLGERIGSYNIVPYIDDKIAKLQDMWREEKVSFDWDDLKDMIEDVARHFSQWQKEQDEISKVNYEGARAVYDNTVQHLQEKIDEKYELGKKDMKEQMLKEAVEGVVDDCGTPARLRLEMPGGSFKIGDKVRIIIVKEDEA